MAAIMFVLVACSGSAAPQANGAATGRSGNIETEQGYWPTYAGFAAVAFPSTGGISPVYRDHIKARYLEYVAVYVAHECIEGREQTAEGFHRFITQQSNSIATRAEVIVGQMLGQSREQIEGTCIESYLYPKTSGQFYLATELTLTVFKNRISLILQGGLRGGIQDSAARLIGSRTAHSPPFLSDLLGDLAPEAQSNAILAPLQMSLNPPEVWVLGLRVREAERCSKETAPRC